MRGTPQSQIALARAAFLKRLSDVIGCRPSQIDQRILDAALEYGLECHRLGVEWSHDRNTVPAPKKTWDARSTRPPPKYHR